MPNAVVTEGLQFPEGPAFDRAGNLYVVEIKGGQIAKVAPDGTLSVFAATGGGPNGQAFGPDGNLYVCNSGGYPGLRDEPGRIERITPDGQVTVLIAEIEGQPLAHPNDIVFDEHGHFYFTNPSIGREFNLDQMPPGEICYSDLQGRAKRIHTGFKFPNGIGITADGRALIVAQSGRGTLHRFPIRQPGVLGEPEEFADLGEEGGAPDGFALDAEGYVLCCGPHSGRIHVFPPGGGASVATLATEDVRVTNVCFGGPEFRTLYATESELGRVVSIEWERPGLRLYPDR